MLTKKSSHAHQGTSAPVSPFVHSLRRGLSQALPTMDRRSFLRRSGLGVGVGIAATQLTLVKKSNAAEGAKVALTGRRVAPLEETAKVIGSAAVIVPVVCATMGPQQL